MTDNNQNDKGRLAAEMIVLLVDELPAHIETMKAQVQNKDYKNLADSLHQLLGAVAYCKLDVLERNLHRLKSALNDQDEIAIAHNFEYTENSAAAIMELFGP